MSIILFLAYNLLFFPLFYVVVNLAGLFNDKVKRGLEGRRTLYAHLESQHAGSSTQGPVVWIHNSSMGEFEQGRPVINEILKRYPGSRVVVTFFSPSGFENVENNDARIIISYLPIDSVWGAQKFIKTIKPDVAVVVRHDIWPNFLWRLHANGIPSVLIDASISDSRLLTYTVFRLYHRTIYSAFDYVMAVTQEQAERLRRIYPYEDKLIVTNDTRYDQVYSRSLETGKIDSLVSSAYLVRQKCMIAGSTWPQDEKILLPAIARAMGIYPDFQVIIAPHEINAGHIKEISDFCRSEKLPLSLYSQLDYTKPLSFRVLLIDQYGILANLYSLGSLAYVGGGFGMGVNSVLEPSAHGCYVIFGPRHLNVPEAKLLIQRKGAESVQSTDEILNAIGLLMQDPQGVAKSGDNAKKMVLDNTGASVRIVDILKKYFTPRTVSKS
jgi:3-deoxy-D-manno-octulosonic-acid transferase